MPKKPRPVDLKRQMELEWERPGVRCRNSRCFWSTRAKTSLLWQQSEVSGLFFREAPVPAWPNERITKKLVAKATRR